MALGEVTFSTAPMSTPADTLAHALAYARRGWHVFPLREGTKAGPLVEGNHLGASVDETTIRGWFERWPTANIGISIEPSGLLVLDVDTHGGKRGLESLNQIDHLLTPTLTARTAGGGLHAIYLAPPGATPGRRIDFAGKGSGLDLLGKGYIVATPSTIDGKAYGWANTLEPAPTPPHLAEVTSERVAGPLGPVAPTPGGAHDFPPATDALLERARAHLGRHGPAIEGQGGDQHTFRAAVILAQDYGLAPTEAFPLLVEWNRGNRPPWTETELVTKIGNASSYAQGERGGERKAIEAGWALEQSLGITRLPERAPPIDIAALVAAEIETEVVAITERVREGVAMYMEDVGGLEVVPTRTYATGNAELDAILGGGVATRQVIGVVGPPSVGKSGFVGCVGLHLERTVPVLHFSTELPSYDLLVRYAAYVEGFPWRDGIKGLIPHSSVVKATAGRRIKMVGSYDLDRADPIAQICREALIMRREYGIPPVIILDYLQMLARGSANMREDIGAMSMKLRILSQALDCSIIVVLTTSRAFYGTGKNETLRTSDDPTIYLNAAKESGDVEYDCATILYLDVDQSVKESPKPARIVVARCRIGDVGFAGARFYGASGRWVPDPVALLEMTSKGREERKDSVKYAEDDAKVLAVVKQAGPRKQSDLANICGMNRARALATIVRLLGPDDGRLKLEDVAHAVTRKMEKMVVLKDWGP